MKPSILLLFLPMLLTCACSNTRYTSYDPATGNKLTEFRTNANYNLANTGSTDDRNAINPLPIVGGSGVDQSRRTSAVPVTEALDERWPTIRAGDLEIYGTVDHATSIRENWIGIRGVAKSLATTILGSIGLKEWGLNHRAQTASEVSLGTGAQAVEVEALQQTTARSAIAADRDVALQSLAAP